jgi:hypothetical protein
VHKESLTAVVLCAAILRPAPVPSRAPDGVASRSSTLDRPRSDRRSGSYEVDSSVWTSELSYSTEVHLYAPIDVTADDPGWPLTCGDATSEGAHGYLIRKRSVVQVHLGPPRESQVRYVLIFIKRCSSRSNMSKKTRFGHTTQHRGRHAK